jgi:outer membrane biosynthesis protein TonB
MRALVLGFAMSITCCAQEPVVHAPVRVSGGVMARNLLTKVLPVFPEEAKKQRVNGLVTFHAIIGTDGRIKDLQVISGPELLRASYLDAVRQWTYKPYLLNGAPVMVETTIALHIAMQTASPSLD